MQRQGHASKRLRGRRVWELIARRAYALNPDRLGNLKLVVRRLVHLKGFLVTDPASIRRLLNPRVGDPLQPLFSVGEEILNPPWAGRIATA
jgi:hypothetical protein